MGHSHSNHVPARISSGYESMSTYAELTSVDSFLKRTLSKSLGKIDLSDKGFRNATKRLNRIEYKQNEYVFKQGETGQALYFVVYGEVVLVTHSENGEVDQILRVAGGNDVLAVHETIYRSKLEVSCKVTSKTAVLLEMNVEEYEAIKGMEFAQPLVARVNYALDLFKVSNIKMNSFFRNIPRDKIHLIAHLFQFDIYAPGDTLLREGEEAERFFCICNGKIAVTAQDKYGFDINLAYLHQGNAFGENEMVNGLRSGATFTCLEKTEVFSIDKDGIDRFMEIMPSLSKLMKERIMAFAGVSNLFHTVPIFASLDEKYKRRLSYASKVEIFSPKDVILKQGGEVEKRIYIILDGKAQVSKGKNKIRVLEHGDYFGEIGEESNSATVSVLGKAKCTCLVVNKRSFLNILNDQPTLYAEMKLRRLGENSLLKHVLDHPVTREAFLRFCESEYTPYNVSFWVAVTQLERLRDAHKVNIILLKALKKSVQEDKASKSKVLEQKAREIFNLYVKVNSPNEINIEGRVRKQISEMVENEQFDYDMFQKAKMEIHNLMSFDTYQRFKDSNAFSEVLEAIGVYR